MEMRAYIRELEGTLKVMQQEIKDAYSPDNI
jgi:hypothetical protein